MRALPTPADLTDLADLGRSIGYEVTDEYIAGGRYLSFRQTRKYADSDTELRVHVIHVEATGKTLVEARGWHHLDATKRGKKVAPAAVERWLRRHWAE